MSNNKTILQQRAEALVSFGISMTERTTITSCLYWMSLGINQFLLEHEVVFISPPLKEVLVSHICNRMIWTFIYMKSAAVDTKWQDVGGNLSDDKEQITQVKLKPRFRYFLFGLGLAFMFCLSQ